MIVSLCCLAYTGIQSQLDELAKREAQGVGSKEKEGTGEGKDLCSCTNVDIVAM